MGPSSEAPLSGSLFHTWQLYPFSSLSGPHLSLEPLRLPLLGKALSPVFSGKMTWPQSVPVTSHGSQMLSSCRTLLCIPSFPWVSGVMTAVKRVQACKVGSFTDAKWIRICCYKCQGLGLALGLTSQNHFLWDLCFCLRTAWFTYCASGTLSDIKASTTRSHTSGDFILMYFHPVKAWLPETRIKCYSAPSIHLVSSYDMPGIRRLSQCFPN